MFDNIAPTYDKDFTHSCVGKALRSRIYKYIDRILPTNRNLNILEINCGSGEDAIYLAQKGHKVLATDISHAMIKVAQRKVMKKKLNNQINFITKDFRSLQNLKINYKFDLIFSNFGGLNCIDFLDLIKLSNNLSSLLNLSGRFIAVIMPKFCLWETLYFTYKLDIKKIFRRNTNSSIEVNYRTSKVKTWYYSPSCLKKVFNNSFKKKTLIPIGFALPPSYLNNFFKHFQSLLKILKWVEDSIEWIQVLSYLSDHYLIDFEKL